MTLADKIVILNNGNVEQVGTPDEIYNNPSNIFVAEFIGVPKMNILRNGIESLLNNLNLNQATSELNKIDERFQNLKSIQNVFLNCFFLASRL